MRNLQNINIHYEPGVPVPVTPDNPLIVEIVSEFLETAKALQQKP